MRDINQLHPRLQDKIGELKFRCAQLGLAIGIGECLRTVDEQNALYAQGRTAPGNIVTNAPGTSYSSQHQWGIAFDFYRNDGTGAYNEDSRFFERVGEIGKSIGLGWGGDWTKAVDRPHLYLPDWGKTPSPLKSKYGTPAQFIATWGNGNTPSDSAPATPTGNTIIASGQQHANNFTGAGIKADGIYGPETKRAGVKVLQTALNMDYGAELMVDGIWGNKTDAALGNHTVRQGETQYMVTALTILLMLKGYDPNGVGCPGFFDSSVKNAVLRCQGENGLSQDGIAGRKTFISLVG